MQNYILCIICMWSLIYLVRDNIILHLLPIILGTSFSSFRVHHIYCFSEFWVWFHLWRLYNVFIIDQWYIQHNYNYKWYNYFWDLWFCAHFIKLFVKIEELCIENMLFERFWVSFIYKENFIYKKVAKGKSSGEVIK